jgi:DNA-binding FadR family transcriptional regulator
MFEREPVIGTMSAQVARILGTRIVGGQYQPGDTLPIESDLCAQFGVSRTTIREAIKSLAGKRLIDVQPKVGTRVLPFADWNLLDREVLTWRLQTQFDAKIVEDIFEMRLCFEPRACYLAAENCSAEDLRVITRKFEKLKQTILNRDEWQIAAQAELDFHITVINLSRNGMFVTIGSAIKAALRVSSEVLLKNAVLPEDYLDLYGKVLTCITDRQPEQAEAAMSVLLKSSRARVLPFAKASKT